MEISTLGIDLSKTAFHVIGLNAQGESVLRRKFSRKQLLLYTANRQRLLIGMEACGGISLAPPESRGTMSGSCRRSM
jgi:transposase